MKVIFVRHGKDDDRYRGGWSALDLTPEGVEQAKRLAKHLKENACDYSISYIITSDLPRAMTTAELISAELGVEIWKDPRLREINNGDLAGLSNEAALVRYPGLFFRSLEMSESYPNGESPNEFYARIKGWFEELCSGGCDAKDSILVVTHGGVINVVYHLVKDVEWSNKGRAFRAAHCSVHVLNVDAMRFEVENKTDFLSC